MVDKKPTVAKSRLFHCSFCRKPQNEVEKLIAGPGVFICNECVQLCVPIVAEKTEPSCPPSSIITPENATTEQLLRTLGGYNGAFEAVGASMQDVVDILREREVSWAAIGEPLGVSRQAAWKRFA